MRIPDETIREIERRVDIVDVVSRYVRLDRKGGRYWGLSPFTTEKTPSFSVVPEEGFYYCFSTNKGGSVFTFLMEMEGLTFPEAVEQLGKEVGIEVRSDPEETQVARERDALKELYRRVAGSFVHLYKNHPSGEQARRYIADRGVSEDMADAFGIGYAPPGRRWLFTFLSEKNYSPGFLAKSGLFSRKYPEISLFRHRVIFPIRDRRGEVIAFGGRALAEDSAKYINSPESEIFKKSRELYGMDLAFQEIRRKNEAILVEGYMDVIACHQAGAGNTVAPLGTAFTEEQARSLHRLCDRVVLVFDADRAGIAAAEKSGRIAESNGLKVEVVSLGGLQDPADILNVQGGEALLTALGERQELFDMLMRQAAQEADISRSEGRELVLQKLFPYIKVVDSEVQQDAYLTALSDLLQVDRESVVSEFRRRGRTDSGKSPQRRSQENLSADLFLMLAAVKERELFVRIRTIADPTDLEDERAQAVYYALEDAFRRGEGSREALLEKVDDALRRLIYERLSGDEFSGDLAGPVEENLLRLRIRKKERQRRRIESRLRRSGSSPEELRELLSEKMALDRELEELKVSTHDRTAE
ncbi:MAG: DNA primase [Alkalispirochaetaceae bacterium]